MYQIKFVKMQTYKTKHQNKSVTIAANKNKNEQSYLSRKNDNRENI